MRVVRARGDYACWLSDEPDPRDVMRVFPANLMNVRPGASINMRKLASHAV
jgi:hypothetical protein